MNLFIRLLLVLIRLWIRPGRLAVHGTGILTLRVWPNDLDTNGHVNNGRYLTLLDLGRFDLLMRLGLGRAGLRGGWVPVLASTMMRFRRSLVAFEKIELRTRLLGWDSTWIYLEQTIARGNDLVAAAYLRGVFLRKGKKIPVSDLLAALSHTEPSPPLPEALRQWLEADEGMYQNAKRDFQSGKPGSETASSS